LRTEKPAATVVFFSSAMSTLIIGGMTERVACGSTTSVMTCPNVSPSARAASACPTGTVLMPERSVSAT
jgi:hypothetical protein